jgi:hypothetical protein
MAKNNKRKSVLVYIVRLRLTITRHEIAYSSEQMQTMSINDQPFGHTTARRPPIPIDTLKNKNKTPLHHVALTPDVFKDSIKDCLKKLDNNSKIYDLISQSSIDSPETLQATALATKSLLSLKYPYSVLNDTHRLTEFPNVSHGDSGLKCSNMHDTGSTTTCKQAVDMSDPDFIASEEIDIQHDRQNLITSHSSDLDLDRGFTRISRNSSPLILDSGTFSVDSPVSQDSSRTLPPESTVTLEDDNIALLSAVEIATAPIGDITVKKGKNSGKMAHKEQESQRRKDHNYLIDELFSTCPSWFLDRATKETQVGTSQTNDNQIAKNAKLFASVCFMKYLLQRLEPVPVGYDLAMCVMSETEQKFKDRVSMPVVKRNKKSTSTSNTLDNSTP